MAPPRTIADITAILDQEKPDPNKAAAQMRAEANAAAPANAGRGELAKFHYKRCQARTALGDFRAASADCEKAVELSEGSVDMLELGRISAKVWQFNMPPQVIRRNRCKSCSSRRSSLT